MNIATYTPSTDQQREAAAKIIRQNVRMAIGNEPFFGSLALRMKWEADDLCPTMATDGEVVIYSPQFVLGKTMDEVKAVAIHEVMHVALLHPLRLGDRDPFIANMAMDYVINIAIADAGYKLPSGALLDYQYRGMAWEQVYDILIKQRGGKSPDGPINPRPGGNPGNNGGKRDYSKGDVLRPQLTKEGRAKLEEEIHVNVSQAESNAKAAGKMPGNLRDIFLKSREPEEDYRHLFEKFVAPIYPRDYTWQRPSRRFIGQDMYLPSILKDGVGELMVAVDTSGSILHDVLENFVGMINHFLARVKPEKLHVVYCDATVYKHEQFRPGAPMELDGCKVQSGGTRFSPVFRYAQDNEIKPKCCVYLTDLECYDFGPEPEYPVLWMQYGNFNGRVPFGEIVKIKTVEA
jgi:predicted metal-dependent peptidase